MNSLIKNEIEEKTIETEPPFQPFIAYVKEDVDLLRSGAGEEMKLFIYLALFGKKHCTVCSVILFK
jgi:hypothetical protein